MPSGTSIWPGPGGWDSPDPGRTRMQSGRQLCWDMLESGTGSARSFTSEPGVSQGEEGLAPRASRHEDPEALVFASFFSSFHGDPPCVDMGGDE